MPNGAEKARMNYELLDLDGEQFATIGIPIDEKVPRLVAVDGRLFMRMSDGNFVETEPVSLSV